MICFVCNKPIKGNFKMFLTRASPKGFPLHLGCNPSFDNDIVFANTKIKTVGKDVPKYEKKSVASEDIDDIIKENTIGDVDD
jgi:hypothetical protein